MGRRRSVMSESFKYELAKDLGFYDVVQREGWEGIRTKDAGNMVKRAIQIAEEHLAKQQIAQTPVSYTQSSAQQGSYGQSYTQSSAQQGSYGQGYTQPGAQQDGYGQSYTQPSVQQGGYGQSYNQGGVTSSSPMTSVTSGAQAPSPSGAYNVNASFPYQNQPPAPGMNPMSAGYEQTSQNGARPSYS